MSYQTLEARTVDLCLLYNCSCTCKFWINAQSLQIMPEQKFLGKNADMSK